MPSNAIKYEEMTDQELNALADQKLKSYNERGSLGPAPDSPPTQAPDYNSMSDDQLHQLLDEKMSGGPQEPEIEEASLGPMGRAQFAIEPIRSNRIQLLRQQFGSENVLEDDKGDLFINQGGQVLPVNKPGFSTADVAEVMGTAPEIIGGMAGAAAAGGLTGGVGTIGGAVVGGAAGSVARQGLSAALGTPQVATMEERATDTALSTALSALGFGIAKGAKAAAKPLVKKARGLLAPKIGLGDAKRAKDMTRIFKQFKIEKPTKGQLAGKEAFFDIEGREKILSEIPFFGKDLRKVFFKQSEDIVEALKGEFGDFMDPEIDLAHAGKLYKKIVNGTVETQRKAAGKLFDEVAEEGAEVLLKPKTVMRPLRSFLQQKRMFTPDGKRLSYRAGTGMDRKTFQEVQRVLGDATDDLMRGVKEKGTLSALDVDQIRRTLDAESLVLRDGEGTKNAARIIKGVSGEYLEAIESALKQKSTALADKFRAAKTGWHWYKRNEEVLRKLKLKPGDFQVADEDAMSKIFRNTETVKLMERSLGQKQMQDAGKRFVRDSLNKFTRGDSITTGQAANFFRSKRAVLADIYGKRKVGDIIKLLEFDQGIKVSFNPSRTAITQISSDLKKTVSVGLWQKLILGLMKGSLEIPEGMLKLIKTAPRVSKPLLSESVERVKIDQRQKRRKLEENKNRGRK